MPLEFISPAPSIHVTCTYHAHVHGHVVTCTCYECTCECTCAQFERYISSNDVSGDQIQTPKMLLVISGAGDIFKIVADSLDPDDVETQTSIPVLVVADSGGAAADIAAFCKDGTEPQVDDYRDEAYVAEAKRWLPAIRRLGESTFNNHSEQLSFFSVSNEVNARNDLALAIQEALINDCPDVNQEALCAVKWEEPSLLKKCLERNAEALLRSKRDDAASDLLQVDLLQVALAHKNVKVVRELISYAQEPSNVIPDELFSSKFNRYPTRDTKMLWSDADVHQRLPKDQSSSRPDSEASGVGISERPEARCSASRLLQLAGMPETRRSASRLLQLAGVKTPRLPSQSSSGGERNESSHPSSPNKHEERKTPARKSKPRTARRLSVALSMSMAVDQELRRSGWDSARPVLSAMVNGYSYHLKTRQALHDESGYSTQPMPCTWTDLMMWAVLAGQHQLAMALWEKSVIPLRAALMASQLCGTLMNNHGLRADKSELQSWARQYENLALDLLDSVRHSEDAGGLVV